MLPRQQSEGKKGLFGLMISGGFWSVTVEKAWYQEHMVAFTAAGADMERKTLHAEWIRMQRKQAGTKGM